MYLCNVLIEHSISNISVKKISVAAYVKKSSSKIIFDSCNKYILEN